MGSLLRAHARRDVEVARGRERLAAGLAEGRGGDGVRLRIAHRDRAELDAALQQHVGASQFGDALDAPAKLAQPFDIVLVDCSRITDAKLTCQHAAAD